MREMSTTTFGTLVLAVAVVCFLVGMLFENKATRAREHEAITRGFAFYEIGTNTNWRMKFRWMPSRIQPPLPQ